MPVLEIAGDVTSVSHYAQELPKRNAEPNDTHSKLEVWNHGGGVHLLERLIRNFLGGDFRNEGHRTAKGVSEHHLWKVTNDKKDNPIHGYDRFLGYDLNHSRECETIQIEVPRRRGTCSIEDFGLPKPAPSSRILVLDDLNLKFREDRLLSHWPLSLKSGVQDLDCVILKLSAPFNDNNNLLGYCINEVPELKEKLVVVLSDDDLRREDISVTRGLSWESAVESLLIELRDSEKLDQLRNCNRLILTIGLAGAVVVRNLHKPRARIIDPRYVPSPTWETVHASELARIHSAWIAAAVAAKLWMSTSDQIEDYLGEDSDLLDNALLNAMRHLREWSGGDDAEKMGIVALKKLFLDPAVEKKDPDLDAATEANRKHRIKAESAIFGKKFDEGEGMRRYEVELDRDNCFNASRILENAPPESVGKGPRTNWTFLPIGADNENQIYDIARITVNSGFELALAEYPHEIFSKKLVTADRIEIERFRSIRRLLQDYRYSRSRRPLCLGVFGKPGTGKSFVIKEIAEGVFDPKPRFLTFNMSQLPEAKDLIGALHQVRDSAIRNENPIVFFDEFDSNLKGQPLGWLRYFLSPMWDGEFQEGEITHAIGKAVFVFAGGIYHKWSQFGTYPPERERLPGPALSWWQPPAAEPESELWKAAKGPDFQSRLQGHLDIMNPNGERDPRNEHPKDFSHILRRAFLIRSTLKAREPGLFRGRDLQIDYGVLEALLKNPEYNHGARSIEAIVNMSELSGRKRFSRASLPPAPQLAMHVGCTKTFYALMDAQS